MTVKISTYDKQNKPTKTDRVMKITQYSIPYPKIPTLSTVSYPTIPSQITFDFSKCTPKLPPHIKGSYSIVKGSLWNTSGYPDFREVLQGGLGDCVFDSTLSLIAYKNPYIIKNMFVGDNKILLYNGTTPQLILYSNILPVISGTQDDLFDEYFTQNKTNILWSHYLLQVFACMINKDPRFNYGKYSGYEAIDQYDVDGVTLMNLFTGKPSFVIDNQTMPQYYDKFNDPNWIFQAGSWGTDYKVPGTTILDKTYRVFSNPTAYIVCSHAHAVISYNSEKQTVTIRNPWGTFHPSRTKYYIDGLQTITVNQFQAAFGGMAACHLI